MNLLTGENGLDQTTLDAWDTLMAPITVDSGNMVQVPDWYLSTSGESIAGWATSPFGAIEYHVDDTIVLNSDLTLYAIWSGPSGSRSPNSGGDAVWTQEEQNVWRSGMIGNNSESWLEMTIEGRADVSFSWMASSEQYDGEIFDYAYLSIDGEAQGCVFRDEATDRNIMEGVAVGGESGWTNVSFRLTEPGTHTIRWTYVKDDVDESDTGEDCVWVANIAVEPLYVASFETDCTEGDKPDSVLAKKGEVLVLPEPDGFSKAKHTFQGWDSVWDPVVERYFPEESYEMPDHDVLFTAAWAENRLDVSPEILSADVPDGGVVDSEFVIIEMYDYSGASIFYTTDGTDPATNGILYTEPFVADGLSMTIRAISKMDDFFDSPVAEFTFSRLPYSAAECLNAIGENVSTGGAGEGWTRVLDDEAHDGVAALRSGEIGDGESSFVEMTVSGEGEIGFWWKVSSEINRNRKYDYVSFLVDGEELSWLGGERDWTNETFTVVGAGEHTFRWVYQKNENELTQGQDCAWLDEVSWTPSGAATEPIPALALEASPEMVAAALDGSADGNLSANVTNAAQYAAYRTWALSVTNEAVSAQAVKTSVRTWLSFALGADALIGQEITSDDVKIESFKSTPADGRFEFEVSVKNVNIGGGSIALEMFKANLRKVLSIEGATSLVPGAFSSDNIEITFDAPVDGKARFTVQPPVNAGNTYFMRVKVK